MHIQLLCEVLIQEIWHAKSQLITNEQHSDTGSDLQKPECNWEAIFRTFTHMTQGPSHVWTQSEYWLRKQLF